MSLVFAVKDLTSKSNSSTTKNGVKFEISVEAEIPASFTKVEATTGYEYEHTDTNGEVWTVSNMREDVDDVFSLGQVVHREARITGGSDWVVALAKVTSFNMQQCSFKNGVVVLTRRDYALILDEILDELGISIYDELYD